MTSANDDPQRHLGSLGTFQRLREAYLSYYDTPFGLADRRLEKERRDLLDRDGGIYRLPLLELRPEYLTAQRSLADSAAAAGAPPELAEFASAGLIPAGRPLYAHQEKALSAGLTRGQNMVITAGTGSGKTESFLLPLLASLLEESRRWQGGPARPQKPWWHMSSQGFTEQRKGETGRTAAVRGLILYPMNALVDDQLTRLRKALDSDAARAWLDANRRGHRFYFGRYTGTTPVTGSSDNDLAVADLRSYLTETEMRGAQAQKESVKRGSDDIQYFVPRLDGAEMRSRWDMAASPPDILITNYSMLNVMLLRERDGHFFESTRKWLDESVDNRFTLVVDELHMYRGTAGTEVAYLIRTLKSRLGLDERPEQLRVLAASASLVPERDKHYLQDFFGVDGNSFEFIAGNTVEPPEGAAGTLAHAVKVSGAVPGQVAPLARELGLVDALRRSFYEPDDKGGLTALAKPAATLAARVFPGVEPETADFALRRMLEELADEPQLGDPRLRAHLFFRNVPGMWACSDPNCSAIPGGRYTGRTIGKVYAGPVSRCTCGSRVLELLYCQNCGDVLLGGFAPSGATQRGTVETMLLADIPDLEKLPDQVRLDRTAANYLVYWPNPAAALTKIDDAQWTADRNSVRFEFRRSVLDPGKGELRNGRDGFTGWSFHVISARDKHGKPRVGPEVLSPYPKCCPSCGDDWEIKFGAGAGVLPLTDRRRQRSPIRGMRTGFEKINQVLTTELAADLAEAERKVIVFTDSRQDAAKLSAGLGLRHYQDLLRLLLYTHLREGADSVRDLELAREYVIDGARTPDVREAMERVRKRDSAAFNELRDIWEGNGTEERAEVLMAQLARPLTLAELSGALSDDLLSMGINPGGPAPSLQKAGRGVSAVRWTTLYDWEAKPPRPRGGLSVDQQMLFGSIAQSLMDEMLNGLFSGSGRDFESLGLGWLAAADDVAPPDASPDTSTAYARASLRVLADQRRFDGMRDGRPEPTSRLRSLWRAIDGRGGPSEDDLRSIVSSRLNDAVRDYVIDPHKVTLRAASKAVWTCTACQRKHLTLGCGLCTKCQVPLPAEPASLQPEDDYYAWKVISGDGRFRLNCAELTGQTDRVDAQSRQSRFQGVFLERDEHELPDAVDLLSVTTTMEAGVDIGALSAVVLGNMPPTRFNYQQRVGRAGRRDTPVAVALTVCRGRSHDEYYFDRPEAITNDQTPKPYLTLDRYEIYIRSLRSEVLRLAMGEIFSGAAQNGRPLDFTNNVHGQFGLVSDWPRLRTELERWLRQNTGLVERAATALAIRTPFAVRSAEVARECAGALIAVVDAAVNSPAGHHELSQRLAGHGVLPMFGFPSSVRYLHLERPKKAYPWPPRGVIDRDLAMAVGQFSPLSEVVRDGKVHAVVGITAFRPVRPKPQPEDHPLGPKRMISVCRSCSYLVETAPDANRDDDQSDCPQCGAKRGVYSSMPLHEPLGFRAGKERDFDGNFAWTPKSISSRAHTDLAKLTQVQHKAATVYSGHGRRFVINDNGGRLFALRAAAHDDWANWGGYVSVEAIENGLLHPKAAGEGEPFEVALGAVQPTDLLFLGPQGSASPQHGVRLDLSVSRRQPSGARDLVDGRRGAWYSLAFLLRTTAAALLDVEPRELNAGIYAGSTNGTPLPFAFIADTLENGAGFSTHLGSEAVLPTFLSHIERYLNELAQESHAAECDSSCYRCLRDYGNMAYHALLDWRLASDLFGLLMGRGLPTRFGSDARALGQWADAYGATMIEGTAAAAAVYDDPYAGRCVVIARHPFEASDLMVAPRLAETHEFVKARYPEALVVFIDTFTLGRDPGRVAMMCEELLDSQQ
ncbi:DEAD/DEAH box helicase [Lentzea sp. NPDC058450]|uniref:DEAD/DEAH box helicase n=1 Tax=Lentzea sp. NPDC058450 TaxID=3346505 RepID=UPI003661914A